MSAAPPLPPALQLPEAAGSGSIEGRILAVERRLLARERAVRLQFANIGHRLRAATQPRRLMSAALGIGSALLVVWWLRGRAPSAHAKAPLPAPPNAGLPWMQGLALAWPLLPASWRARVSPATVTTVVSLGAALVQRLARPHRR